MTRRPNGFTLLEILVAVIVLGFLTIGLSQGVRFSLAALSAESRLASRDDDLDAADRVLRRMVRQMVPGSATDPGMVEGGPESLAFVTRLPGARDLVEVAIGIADHRLVLRWTPRLHARRLVPALRHSEVLLSNVAGLQFAYQKPAGGWVRFWTEPRLPALVRIHLAFPAGDARHWPDLVLAAPRSSPAG